MKKRITAITAVLSLMPFGQPMVIGTGAILTSAAVLFSVPEKAKAENEEFYFKRAYKKAEEGDYYGAISDYNNAIEINPEEARYYALRSTSKSLIKDFRGAISDLNMAITRNPDEGWFYLLRGNNEMLLNNKKDACNDWRKASAFGTKYAVENLKNYCS